MAALGHSYRCYCSNSGRGADSLDPGSSCGAGEGWTSLGYVSKIELIGLGHWIQCGDEGKGGNS